MGALFAHFQVQARLAVRHAFTVSLHSVKLLIEPPFNGASTSQPTVVPKCISASFEISQIQLRSARYNWLLQ